MQQEGVAALDSTTLHAGKGFVKDLGLAEDLIASSFGKVAVSTRSGQAPKPAAMARVPASDLVNVRACKFVSL